MLGLMGHLFLSSLICRIVVRATGISGGGSGCRIIRFVAVTGRSGCAGTAGRRMGTCSGFLLGLLLCWVLG